MVFKTNKFVVTKKSNTDQQTKKIVFRKLEDVPGGVKLLDTGYSKIAHWIEKNIHKTDIVLQAVEHKVTNPIIRDKEHNIVAVHGWRIVEQLGKGKDGHTFLAHRFSESPAEKVTLKLLSNYGNAYLNHSKIFNSMIDNESNIFMKIKINQDLGIIYYERNIPFVVVQDDFVQWLPKLCEANAWAIKNTGFVFWDFGFASGKNYMLNRKNELVWIDYGGAGMLRCLNFKKVYEKNRCDILVDLEPQPSKENLVIANSDFVMCQFLFHIEYWKQHPTVDVWSSMLQMRKAIIPEIVSSMDTILKDDLTIGIYRGFKKYNWTKPATWQALAEFINENT